MDTNVLFQQTDYHNDNVMKGSYGLAKPTKRFYSYYSNTPYEPFGFAATQHIYLASWDFYDGKYQVRFVAVTHTV